MKTVAGIALPDTDTHFTEHLEKGPLYKGKGTYQFAKIQIALEHCTRRRRAVDVGAHVGLWTRVLVDHFDHVEAFEPLSHLAECWLTNVPGGNSTLYVPALSYCPGKGRMLLTPDNSGNNHIINRGGEDTVRVEFRTLDSFQFKDVDLIKIDTEGYEKQVILGGEGTIRHWEPIMVVEQKKGHAERYNSKTGDAITLLESWGAKVLKVKSGDYIMGWK